MVNQANIDPHIQKIASLIRQKLEAEGIPVEKIILFGSHARGTARSDSDIDLCVVSSQFGKDYHNELVMLQQFARLSDNSMDIVPYSPKDLSEKYDTLASEIRKYGISFPVSH